MNRYYHNKSEVCKEFQTQDWQLRVFKEFESTLTSKTRPFPCIFGVSGFQKDQLRYGFSEELKADEVYPALKHFADNSHSYGKNTSLVFFSKPSPVESVAEYEKKFWDFLYELAQIDERPWPSEIPHKIDDQMWEFCCAGEPIFVVCNTPAHVLRQSRRSSSFMVTFQPRWVFEDVFKNPEVAQKSIKTIRERLKQFDIVSRSPHLGYYGEKDNREYAQYFLRENNTPAICPFHSLTQSPDEKNDSPKEAKRKKEVSIKSVDFQAEDLITIVNSCLPTQGAIEIQQDKEGKEHSWHSHDTDETIIILEGHLKFYWKNGEITCKAGDVIELPKGVAHGSIALDGVAKYIIAFRQVDI